MKRDEAISLFNSVLQLQASNLAERQAEHYQKDWDEWFAENQKIQKEFRETFEKTTGHKLVFKLKSDDDSHIERWEVE